MARPYGKWLIFLKKTENVMDIYNKLSDNNITDIIKNETMLAVLTDFENKDEIGFKIATILEKDLTYKLQDQTDDQIFYKDKRIPCQKLFWNHGNLFLEQI